MWLDHRTKTLTLEARRIIADERITIERPDIGDWNLYIHGVELSDAGKYMCQVNTVPVKIKYVILTVHGKETPHNITSFTVPTNSFTDGQHLQTCSGSVCFFKLQKIKL